jgi:alpha 1,6-mannosyltransferase
MLSSRVGNGSRYWLAAITFFCIFYWILKAERYASRSASTWKTKFYNEVPTTSPTSEDVFAEDGHEEGNDFVPITKAHPYLPSSLGKEFPKLIWQTSNTEGVERWANETATWTGKNPNWKYNLLTGKLARGTSVCTRTQTDSNIYADEGATAFVYEHFRHRPSIVQFWSELQQVVLKADFIRYLAMLARGGVYSDMDTSCLVPIDDWIPADMRNETINAVVGIEYDDTTYHMFVRPISFNQWTLMAKPGHALFEAAVRRVMSNLEYIARRKRVQIRELKLDKMEVLEATGPGMITDAVMAVLKDQVENIRWETFHLMKKPKIFGDVLVLPVRAFAGGQKHSHSSDKAYGPAYVQHHFGRSWYRPQAPASVAEEPTHNTAELEAEWGAQTTSEETAEADVGTSGEKGDKGHEDEMPDEMVPDRTVEKIAELDESKMEEKVVDEDEGRNLQVMDKSDADNTIEKIVDEVSTSEDGQKPDEDIESTVARAMDDTDGDEPTIGDGVDAAT